MSPNDRLATLNEEFASIELEERMRRIAEHYPQSVFTSSLGMEDQVLTWAIAVSGAPIRVVTLETGRLFSETLSLLQITRERYGIEIEEFTPNQGELDLYQAKFGIDGFYNSVVARKACCDVRKLRPLKKALAAADAWVTGLRRSQSGNRASTAFVEWDEVRQLIKFNPLADWSAEQIQQAVSAHEIPVNPLHFRGYPSIGCEPCTRAIKPGEQERAGRWWWEQDNSRECGLHAQASRQDKGLDSQDRTRELADAHA